MLCKRHEAYREWVRRNRRMETPVRIAVVFAAAMLAWFAAPALAAGQKTGFATTSTTTQGNSGKTDDSANPDNQGLVTTISGPYGQVKQGKTANTTTTCDEPGHYR